MDPLSELITAIAGLIREFGIPLAILFAFAFLLWKRILILGSELDRKAALYEKEIDYREARRIEEREGRLAAEKRLERATEAFREISPLLRDIFKEVIRGGRERLDE
jgi:hypothetical protein